MQMQGKTANRWLVVMAAMLVALGAATISAGAASASTPVRALVVIKFSDLQQQVTLTIPTPPCRTVGGTQACTWMLSVDVHGGSDVIQQTGSTAGGILTVGYPPGVCGEIQADALVGSGSSGPWHLEVGHRHTITSPSCPTTPPAAGPTNQLPFTGDGPTTTTAPPVAIAAAAGVTPAAARLTQLPFTGIDAKPMLIVGTTLVLLGLWLLSTLEQRRRALRRMGAAAQISSVAESASRASRWFLGL